MPAEVTTHADHSMSDTLQSLIVAFVLAMAFRGFVLEGFIIPTGSMAPTLMGQHTLWHSPQTGYEFRVDASDEVLQRRVGSREVSIFDPMVWRPQRGGPYRYPNAIATLTMNEGKALQRMGDRILITKAFFPFTDFERWDVVVFKNPTDPQGDSQNYIKRLIGLPDEKILFIAGDVFAGVLQPGDRKPGAAPDLNGYQVQRKPEYVQRTVWQPVYHSEFIPIDPTALAGGFRSPWQGDHWQTDGRSYRCDSVGLTRLGWDNNRWPLNDFTDYDMIGTQDAMFNVADLRVAAAMVPDQAGLATTLEIRAHNHVFQFSLTGSQAIVRYRPQADEDGWIGTDGRPIELPPPGRVFNVEFWHVDQSMSIWIDGSKVAEVKYEWSPAERLQFVTGKSVEPWDQALNDLTKPELYPPATVTWSFSGSPVTMHHVRMDRDLFYQPATFNVGHTRGHATQQPDLYGGIVSHNTPAYGTSPAKPAMLDHDQFFMCGDNSPASSDSRLWGNPDPIVAAQIGDSAPFVVNRKLMLGKAWAVYFPAPYRMTDDGVSFIPDFGRLRFIR